MKSIQYFLHLGCQYYCLRCHQCWPCRQCFQHLTPVLVYAIYSIFPTLDTSILLFTVSSVLQTFWHQYHCVLSIQYSLHLDNQYSCLRCRQCSPHFGHQNKCVQCIKYSLHLGSHSVVYNVASVVCIFEVHVFAVSSFSLQFGRYEFRLKCRQ